MENLHISSDNNNRCYSTSYAEYIRILNKRSFNERNDRTLSTGTSFYSSAHSVLSDNFARIKHQAPYHNAPYTYTLHVSTYAFEIPKRFIPLVNIYNHSRFVDHSMLESIIDHPSRSRISFLYFLILFLPLYRYYTSLFFLHILLAFWRN